MSNAQQRAFYGDDGTPYVYEIVARLCALTGSEECAVELVEAADEVERNCGPLAALSVFAETLAWVN
jgi:hypothetical protein